MDNSIRILASEAQLFYGRVLVGRLADVNSSEDTFYGDIRLTIDEGEGALERELIAFIRYSLEFNRLCETSQPPNPSGFSRFAHLMGKGQWRVTWPNETIEVSEAPLFFKDQVSWRTDE